MKSPKYSSRPRRPRRGFMSMPLMFVFLGLLILFAFMVNTGLVVSRKVDAQNAADAVAYSTALQRARAMNAITAANHLMGELHAVVVLHHSFGGDELDDRNKPRKRMDKDVKVLLPATYQMARSMSKIKPLKFTLDDVNKDPEVGGAIGASRTRLQRVQTWAYVTHSIGGFLEMIGKFIPYAGKVIEGYGMTVSLVATAFEIKVWLEWQALKGVEIVAKVARPVKKGIQSIAIPALNYYNRALTYYVPFVKTPAALKRVAELNKVEADIYPGPTFLPPAYLPVEAEPATLPDAKLTRSQLIRASTPWIRHWRVPVLKFSEVVLKLSRFKMFYVDHTNQWTLELTKRAKRSGVNLLIMKDVKLTTDDKGEERWTKKEGSGRADELFCSLGFAIRKSPDYQQAWLFRDPTPNGILAYSQAMVYNVNPQQGRKPANATTQRVLGWDTLNWDPATPVDAWRKDDTRNTFPVVNVPEPRVLLNWRVKLVPASRMTPTVVAIKAAAWPEGREHLTKMLPVILPKLSQVRTH